MSKRPERMALYIRESDPRLANSVTIESQAKLAREYGEKEGYIYNPDLEFREAISAYDVPYIEREELLKMLDAARKKLFDVLVVAEVRAIGRRQVEVLVIHDMLLKYGVRLETVKEKFGEDAMSREVLASRSLFAEIEVEQSKIRMTRGRTDRVVIGQAPNGGTCVYTHRLVDTETEVSGRYELNDEVVYTDTEGKPWTRVDVALFFCSLLARGGSLAKAAQTLNAMGVPSAKGKHWTPETIRRIVSNPILYGQPYANRYKQLALGRSKNGRQVSRETMRPAEEWIPLPACPAIITKTTFEEIQIQIQRNKVESLGNNKRTGQVGLLRAGYIFCGICGRKMYISYPSRSSIRNRSTSPYYLCRRSTGGETGVVYNHRTQINLHYIERAVREKIRQALLEPDLIRARVEEIRSRQRPTVDTTSIEATIVRIDKSIRDLDKLAEQATTGDLAAGLAQQANQLERQKSEATAMLHSVVEIEEQRMETELELRKFEQWAKKMRPFLTDAQCLNSAAFDELRLAVQILGIRVSVYPTQGQWEYRYRIEAADSAGNPLKAQQALN